MKKKYYLFDNGILQPQKMSGICLKTEKAVKYTENSPLFSEEFFSQPPKKWEARYDNSYPNIIYDPECDVFRCYYTLCSYDQDSASADRKERARRDYVPMPNRIVSLGYAESRDGLVWEKPALGLVDFEGNKDNNLLFRYAHGTGVFLDIEEKDEDRRYKLVTKVDYPGGPGFMAVNFSKDGIHWGPMIPWPKYCPPADAHNFPFRDRKDGKFKVITRTWQDGIRICSICESTDFINWTEPREIMRGSGFGDQVYSMPVWQTGGIYLGFASMYHEGDRIARNFDTVDLELTYATETGHFNRVAPGQYLIERGNGCYPDGTFDCGCIYSAAPVEKDGKIWLYYMGGNGRHTNFRETSLGLAILEKDKFAYYETCDLDKPGVITTAPFHFFGEDFQILWEERPDHGREPFISVALTDSRNGECLEGFSDKECQREIMEDGWMRVSFSKDFMSLGNYNPAVRITFNNGRVYAIKGEVICASARR